MSCRLQWERKTTIFVLTSDERRGIIDYTSIIETFRGIKSFSIFCIFTGMKIYISFKRYMTMINLFTFFHLHYVFFSSAREVFSKIAIHFSSLFWTLNLGKFSRYFLNVIKNWVVFQVSLANKSLFVLKNIQSFKLFDYTQHSKTDGLVDFNNLKRSQRKYFIFEQEENTVIYPFKRTFFQVSSNTHEALWNP